jgi:mono/diheme cytochrome c family protein
MSQKILVLLFVSAVLVSAACFADDSNANSAALTGNPIYKKDCAKCHGKTAEGRHFGGPSLVSEKVAGASADELRGIIANGKGHMPKFTGKLADSDIDQLVQRIKAANQK